jgi:tRNA threonylcarbamoyladenosine biosynthesis protein TsaB
MKILAIETATEACSCALWVDGEQLQHYELAPRRHADIILTMVDEILIKAGISASQLDAIAFGRGPGSFTGLRIACGVAQGIALGLDIPVIPLSTLAILAQSVYEHSQLREIFVCLDARMAQVYWACYVINANSRASLCNAEQLSYKQEVILPNGSWFGAGSGLNDVADFAHLNNMKGYQADYYPQAQAMLALARAAYINGQYLSAEQAQPMYLRNNVV